MTYRLAVYGGPEARNREGIRIVLLGEVGLAQGQVIEVYNYATGDLHDLIDWLVYLYDDCGFTLEHTPGELAATLAFNLSDEEVEALPKAPSRTVVSI